MKKFFAQKGFSLVELVIAVSLVGVIALIIGNIPSAINLVTSSQSESKVREVVAKRVEDIRLAGYDSLANGTTAISDLRLQELNNVSASTVITDCPVQVCTQGEQIKQVRLTVSWNESGEPKTYQLTTLVAKDGLK